MLVAASVSNPRQLAYTGSLRRQGDESADYWFTPRPFVDACRDVLGGIDLDPFSCWQANEAVVHAKRFFSREDNAFRQEWRAATVFMNPPYSRGTCAKAVGKFLAEFEARRFRRGIVLVNNMTDTRWFRELLDASVAVCLLTGRLSFVTLDGKRVSGNTRGQCSFLFSQTGHGLNRFRQKMAPWGRVLVDSRRCA